MTKFYLTFITVHLFFAVDGQVDTTKSVYKNLEVKKFYSVGMSAVSEKGKTTYEIDDKRVDKATYEKYNDTWKNMETCKPCILETFDINEKLLHRAVHYTDCAVGQWIEYYADGKIKMIGHYKENDTGNWKNAYNRGYCSVKHGIWTYFDKNGNTIKTEQYIDNILVK